MRQLEEEKMEVVAVAVSSWKMDEVVAVSSWKAIGGGDGSSEFLEDEEAWGWWVADGGAYGGPYLGLSLSLSNPL